MKLTKSKKGLYFVVQGASALVLTPKRGLYYFPVSRKMLSHFDNIVDFLSRKTKYFEKKIRKNSEKFEKILL